MIGLKRIARLASIVGGIMVLATSCGPETLETPPADITGRWFTQAESYSDRAFEITEDRLYLHQGETFGAYRIEEIQITREDLPLYSIEYRGEENEIFSFRFYFSPEAGGTIFFPNQRDMKWHKDPERPVPWDALR